MTPVTCFSGKNVALFGLGGSGLATALALIAGGASVAVWDDNEEARLKAAERGLAVVDLSISAWSRFDSFVMSPGVPLTHPKPHWTVEKAKAAGVEVIGDIELFCRERAKIAPQAPFIAITGTNGKSTTTALIAHLLREAGKDVQMGGNIGTAILSLAPPANDRFHVVECSTFQIDLAPSLAPSVGVQLNITPDHLDRHGTLEHYASIKERLVANSGTAIVGTDDSFSRDMADRRASNKKPLVRLSVEGVLDEGLFADGTQLVRAHGNARRIIANLAGIGSLRGAHNAQNAVAAFAALDALGIEEGAIAAGLKTFPGLAHRMEQVGRMGSVLFVNDSKATNADAAEKALLSFPDGIFWIIGGVQKEGGIEPLAPHFSRVAKAYLIGKSSDVFAATLEGKVSYAVCGTLDKAVELAASDATLSKAKEPVVLLSPACASYDQYRNFELRGAHFRDLVRALPGITMTTSPEADLNAFTR